MKLYQDILDKKKNISLVGLGYVGLPIAVAFAKKANVIGFDISEKKIAQYKQGLDPTKEVGDEAVKNTTVVFTANEEDLKKAQFHIVAVPTPVGEDKTPDLTPVISATKTVARNLTKGSYVVFESTVYPGVTEDICISLLEEGSGLQAGIDFKVGYSPERINPGDQVHRLETIVKVVSGIDEESLDVIAKVYELVVDAGVYKAATIKVAEAAKVIENAQRDINIAFMNELSIIFNRLNIDTIDVLKAAGTKWNFLPFRPGLVGGHCIGVDPYYLTYKAAQVGYTSKIILSGRQINDDMGAYVVGQLIKTMVKHHVDMKEARVGIMGFTFKENCPDTRNTRVIDMVLELKDYGITPVIVDPVADQEEALEEYGLSFDSVEELKDLDALIVAVSHDVFKDLKTQIPAFFKTNTPIVFDLKALFERQDFSDNVAYWRL